MHPSNSGPCGGHWGAFGPLLWASGPRFCYINYHLHICFLTCVQNFSTLALGALGALGVCQEHPTPSLKFILGGCWWFLTGYLEDGVILDLMNHHNMSFWTCVPNFRSLAWLKVYQDPPILGRLYLEDVDGYWLDTWRMGSSLTPLIVMICDSWVVCRI